MATGLITFAGVSGVSTVAAFEPWSPVSNATLSLQSPAFSEDQVINVTISSVGRHFVKLLDIPPSNHIELYARALTNSNEANIYVGGASGYQSYMFGLRSQASEIQIIRYSGGVQTALSTVSKALTEGAVYKMRCLWNGNTGDLKYKVWADADVEPAHWDIEINDTGINTAGTSGLFTFDSVLQFDSVGYGTNGDSAPTSTGPTITDIDGDESVYPGQSFVITGTNFGATQGTGTVDIDGVAQTVTAWSDTSITCTAVRGGNEYGTGKTLTVTTDAATTATLTVAQEAEPGTFAVTAASPNTTDPASLWSGLVDTATGDPVTVVDGDQAWVKDPNNLGNLSITPAGAISADTTGDFVVQFWKASEGVWGSDQTVSFTLPAEATDNWPFGKAINPIATKNWTWGSRHPMTGMRVRIFK